MTTFRIYYMVKFVRGSTASGREFLYFVVIVKFLQLYVATVIAFENSDIWYIIVKFLYKSSRKGKNFYISYVIVKFRHIGT